MPPRLAPNSQLDLDSIYYIHPSEGPNSVTVTLKLDGSNYLTWNRSMKRALGAKNKLKFIDRSTENLDEYHLNFDQWKCYRHERIFVAPNT